MTQTKTRKKPAAQHPPQPPVDDADPSDADPSDAEPPADPGELLATLPALTDAQRESFTSQFNDAECAKTGAGTKSGTVRVTGLMWAAAGARVMANPVLAAKVGYAPTRLAWLIELIVKLDAARAGMVAAATPTASVRTSRDVARLKARDARRGLGAQLANVVRNDKADEEALAFARGGSPQTDDALVTSLGRLADLADTLNKRAKKDARTGHLLEAACVKSDAGATARAAATALSAAGNGVALGGGSSAGRDTPEVNLVEGRVVEEMRILRSAIRDGGGVAAGLPLLRVPPTLQREFSGHNASADEPDPGSPAPPGDGEGASVTAPPAPSAAPAATSLNANPPRRRRASKRRR